ncbi:polysaccharide export protein [Pseudoalteromonas tunicata]|uniref:polysaccharide biosynthesis/export family protein n=1 Tax=Pseudoalteromonas tunicata TaxID=314281 RepID=UPI00273F3450|nr:polysaccharide biosynthesis/export family protein [Pseudoalteromonas tunicata]MDP5214178.1 polysaccharide export protein [Pseudoalteromonas tunicata]
MVKYLSFVLILTFSFSINASEFNQAYQLGAGDSIQISVYQEPDLAFSGQISQQGKVDFPLLGSIDLSGFTQQQAKAHLELLLKDGYLVAPSVSIRVSSYRPFFIYGEVRSPGSYTYQPDITLEQVIALSGGLKDRASRTQWQIQRGQNKSLFLAKSDTVILPGDVIKIEKSFF